MSTPLRVYSELLPYDVVTRPSTLALLARYELEVVLAVRPWQIAELPRAALSLRDAGIRMTVWPMLSDEHGRWANADNALLFAQLVRDVCDALDGVNTLAREVLFDLEPPFARARALTSASVGLRGLVGLARARGTRWPSLGAARPGLAAAGLALADVARELHASGVATSSVAWPLVALDARGTDAWQALLGTPVDALGTARVSIMMYTSILEGWSRGGLSRRHTAALLAAASERVVSRWGSGAGLSLGCVGTGAFDDEPTYRGPDELAEDASIARAAGCRDLSLFDLGGVLARPPAEAWLDAFVGAGATIDAAVATGSRRLLAARTLARVATWALRGSGRSR